MGVIGAAGQGKSSLVRRWLRKVWADKTIRQPESAFWWNFQERASVDEFLLAALSHLSGTHIDPHLLPSTSMRVQTLGSLVTSRPSLFILDGVETFLHQQSMYYGLLTSPSLRDFLAYLAGIAHNSLCVLISRTPLFDLLDYPSYRQYTLQPMQAVDGYTLAQRLGLKGSTETLEEIVAACDAHPLTLCMMCSYLTATYQGDGDAFLARYRMIQLLAEQNTLTASPHHEPHQKAVWDNTVYTEEEDSATIAGDAAADDVDADDLPLRIPTGIELTIPDDTDDVDADDLPLRIPTGIELTIPAAADDDADDLPLRIPTGIELTIPDADDDARDAAAADREDNTAITADVVEYVPNERETLPIAPDVGSDTDAYDYNETSTLIPNTGERERPSPVPSVLLDLEDRADVVLEEPLAPSLPAPSRTITISTGVARVASTTRALSIPDTQQDNAGEHEGANEHEDEGNVGNVEEEGDTGDTGDTDNGDNGEGTEDVGLSAVTWFCEEYLSSLEQLLLVVMSLFRRPVDELAIGTILRTSPDRGESPSFYAPLLALNDDTFQAVLEQLVRYRIVAHDEEEGYFIIQPLVHTYAQAYIQQDPTLQVQLPTLHNVIKDYYLSRIEADNTFPTLHDLVPAKEACYHACSAGLYDAAWQIYLDYLCQRREVGILTDQMGAYEMAYTLFLAFFPHGDITQLPLLSDTTQCYHLLEQTARCLYHLGNYPDAITCYQQWLRLATDTQHWHIAHTAAYHLAHLCMELGMLSASSETARQALDFARIARNRYDEMMALSLEAWVAHVRGHLVMARSAFVWAEFLERDANPDVPALYGQRGVWYAEHLLQTGCLAEAYQVIAANLEMGKRYQWKEEISQCYRILAIIASQQGDQATAYQHYLEAIKIARSMPIGNLTLIEALLAYGRWAACGAGSMGLIDADQSEMPYDMDEEMQRTIATLLGEKSTATGKDSQDQANRGHDESNAAASDSVPTGDSASRKFWVKSDPETARRFTVARVGTRARTRGRPLRVPLDGDNQGQGQTPAKGSETRGNTGGGWIKLIDGISEQLPFRPERTIMSQIKERLSSSAMRQQAQDQRAARMARGSNADNPPEQNKPREHTSAFQVARSTLEEALSRAIAGGYLLHEAAIRIALAYVSLAIGDRETAHTEACYAQQLSVQIGYHRGQVEAAVVLAEL